MADHVLTDTVFESFDLHPLLIQGLADCGFTRCTPIQAMTLPVALAGRDVAGQAQTGTGKTCAFLVAVMNHLLTKPARAARKDNDPRALVIAPTRELAIQIDKDAQAIGAQTGLRTALIYGGVDYDKQRQMLRDGCDIIIATPGRMLDYYKQHVFRLDNVEVMVIDEADRMFDLGFIKDVRYIFRRLPSREERQVLLYSATLSHRVLELAYEHMHEAEKLVVETDHVTADKVRQVVYFPAKEEKLPLLLNLLKKEQPTRALVFVNTRAQTERVRDNLRRHGYSVGALSGDVPQDKRQKVLKRFKDSQLDMLVCTDVAARGLHIPHVSHVFNYDLPQDAEDYVHRVGRTARLGEEGDAISFACDLYAMSLPDIQAYIEQKLPVGTIEPEWLVMPKAPPASERHGKDDKPAAEGREGGPRAPRKRRRRSGADHSAGGHAGSHAQSGKPQQDAAPAAPASGGNDHAATVSAPADQTANSPAGEQTAADAPRKRRRRRGGRNRSRGGQNGAGNQAQGQATASTSSDSRGSGQQARQGQKPRAGASRNSGNGQARSKPRDGQGGHDGRRQSAQTTTARPKSTHQKTTQVQATPAGKPAAKTGFFRRLADGLFGGR